MRTEERAERSSAAFATGRGGAERKPPAAKRALDRAVEAVAAALPDDDAQAAGMHMSMMRAACSRYFALGLRPLYVTLGCRVHWYVCVWRVRLARCSRLCRTLHSSIAWCQVKPSQVRPLLRSST